jgi:hypothetical protein
MRRLTGALVLIFVVGGFGMIGVASAGAPGPTTTKLRGAFSRTQGGIQNWNGEVKFDSPAGGVHEPETIEELVKLVGTHERVRVVGSGHSFNRSLAPAAGGALVQVNALTRIEPVEARADRTGTVWVEAGATLADLSKQLAAEGWALEGMPQSSEITVSGAINGVHGSTLQHPSTISEQVTGMELVTHTAQRLRVPEHLLPTARVHLGVLGAVARVQLRVVPAFLLKRSDDAVSAAEALDTAKLRQSLRDHDHALLFTYDPGTDKVVRQFLDVASDDPNLAHKTAYAKNRHLMTKLVFWTTARLPEVFTPFAHGLIRKYSFRPQKRPSIGASHYMFQDDLGYPSHDVSVGIPLDDLQSALRDLKNEFARIGYEQPLPFGIRILGATDATKLAMNSGRDTAVIEMVSPLDYDRSPKKSLAFAQARRVYVDVLTKKYAGRPHWQKSALYEGSAPGVNYPKLDWDRFARLRQVWGGEKFSNDWADRYAPGGARTTE